MVAPKSVILELGTRFDTNIVLFLKIPELHYDITQKLFCYLEADVYNIASIGLNGRNESGKTSVVMDYSLFIFLC